MVARELTATVIEPEEEVVTSWNYRFARIGHPVPIKPSHAHSQFDPTAPPSKPLAVSQRFGVLFVAHSTGFCVARTKDVMDSAEKGESGLSVQELSLVDLDIGKVSILALSPDSSTLAASMGSHLYLFSVTAILNKERKPILSCYLDDSSCIKDMRWAPTVEKHYVVLSIDGKLYHGAAHEHLKDVMDNVDAVEWSEADNFVAVAKKNVLSILSSEFKERLSISLSLKSCNGEFDANCIMKVDCIRWVRADCIVIGCFEVTNDGEEQNYVVQVITSKDGKITDASSNPIALSFNDMFLGFVDDAVPFGTGPFMFLSYLNECELAFITNRKNTDQHIVLFGWSLDEIDEAAIVDFSKDTWFPRIDSQGNGDDNLVLGLSLDKASHNENVKLTLGVEEKEVAPCCILLCLTVDGKLTMFHFASVAGPSTQAEAISASSASDEEDKMPNVVPLECRLSEIPSKVEGRSVEQFGFKLESREVEADKLNKIRNDDIFVIRDQQPSTGESFSLTPAEINYHGERSIGYQEAEAAVNFPPWKGNEQQKMPIVAPNQDREPRQPLLSGQQGKIVENLSATTCRLDGPRVALSQSWSNGKLSSSKASDGRLSAPPSSGPKVNQSADSATTLTNAYFSGSSHQSASYLKQSGPTSGYPSRQRASTEVGEIQSLPAIHASHSPLQGSSTLGKPSNYMSSEKFRTPSPTGLLSSEPSLSKRVLNVEEMAKVLDNLLERIEGAGGFKDYSIALHNSSVITLEEGIRSLSQNCRKWRGVMDERFTEIHFLLDKTVQVLARKIYMEGIVKQATDTRFLDLWNRQKLNSELELKQQHILEANQDLTNQLIELERHFNTLELNKFGESGGVQMNRKAFPSRHEPPRHIQSLHSLHNTMAAQLAAAQQLSDCLSKQMSLLSVESPTTKEKNVKRELFETIGIPYSGAYLTYPDEEKSGDTASKKKFLNSLGSAIAKEQPRRNESSSVRSSESETARRRRDSLDRNWASFEPPKTTVKRMLLQEDRPKVSENRPSLSINWQQKLNGDLIEEPVIALEKQHVTASTFLYPSKSKVIRDAATKLSSTSPLTSSFHLADDLPNISHVVANVSARSSELAPLVSESWQKDVRSLNSERSRSLTTSLGTGKNVDYSLPPAGSALSPVDPATSNSPPGNTISSSTTSSSFINSSTLPTIDFSSAPSSFLSKPIVPSSSIVTSISLLSTSSSTEVQTVPVSISAVAPSPIFPSTSSFQASEMAMYGSKTIKNNTLQDSATQPELASGTSSLELQLSISRSTSEATASSLSASQVSFSGISSVESNVALNPSRPSDAPISSCAVLPVFGNAIGGKTDNSDATSTQEDEMEEEAPEISQTTELSIGNLGGFGIGTAPNPSAAKSNPFGAPFVNTVATPPSSPISMAVPGELFRPASFSFPQPSQSSQPTNLGGFDTAGQVSTGSRFGQPAQIGSGQQALGSVLGAFGQSRQFGTGIAGSGFAGNQSMGGFSNAPPSGGFASLASTSGGFSGVGSAGAGFAAATGRGGFATAATGGGGFAAAATGGSGFAAAVTGGGGFAGAALGGGFGGFSNQQGSSAFSAFGSSGGAQRPPSELFTQIRR